MATKFNFCHKIKTFRIHELLSIELRSLISEDVFDVGLDMKPWNSGSVLRNFTTPYCKVMNKRSHAALKSAFILYVYTSETYLTFYPFKDFQY